MKVEALFAKILVWSFVGLATVSSLFLHYAWIDFLIWPWLTPQARNALLILSGFGSFAVAVLIGKFLEWVVDV